MRINDFKQIVMPFQLLKLVHGCLQLASHWASSLKVNGSSLLGKQS